LADTGLSQLGESWLASKTELTMLTIGGALSTCGTALVPRILLNTHYKLCTGRVSKGRKKYADKVKEKMYPPNHIRKV